MTSTVARLCVASATWIGVVSIFLACCVDGASAEKRIPLLIGNKDYAPNVGPLKNPLNDIRLIANALQQIGFQVTKKENATSIEIKREVNNFARGLEDTGDSTIGFFYYSGHGAARARDHVNYLIPVDVKDTSNDDFWFESVSLDDVIRELTTSAPKASLFVVFDACRNELHLPIKSINKGFEVVQGTNGVFIAFSTSPNDSASDIGDSGGPYASALASELVKPGQHHVDIFLHVKETVFGNTGGRQRPWESNGFIHTIVLAEPQSDKSDGYAGLPSSQGKPDHTNTQPSNDQPSKPRVALSPDVRLPKTPPHNKCFIFNGKQYCD
jgi:uncharacterized caspase-like protein